MRLAARLFKEAPAQIAAVLFVVLIFTRFGGFFSLPPASISTFWPANALLFCGAWLMENKTARLALLLALPTYFGAEVWIGYPPANAAIYSLANVTEVVALLVLLRQTVVRSLAFDNLRDLFVFLAMAFLASPVGGGIGALGAAHAGGDFATVLMRWSLADFFGYCLCVPLVLTWGQCRQFFPPGRPAVTGEFVVLLTVLLAVTVLSSGALGLTVPFGAQFLPMPILLWAALRFGPPGGAIATIIVACVAFLSAAHGVGPFAVGAPEENAESLQLFFASLVISVMTIASLNAERKHSFGALWQEVAERRQAEQALRESEARYRRIVDTANEGVWLLDPDFRTTFVNARMAGMLGRSADEMIGRPMNDFMPMEDVSDHERHMERRRRGIVESYERRFLHKDGRVVWTLVSATPIMEEGGRFGGSFGMFTDITERKQTEQDLLLMNFALDNVSEAVYLIDENAGFHFANEAACRQLGYTRQELLALHVADIDPDFPITRWQDHWHELKTQRSLLFEGHHKARDGRIYPVEISANYFEYGEQRFNLALVRDITQRKQVEEELRHYRDSLEDVVLQRTAELRLARDAAEAANKAKSVFLANMSHELRTPLNAILGFSRMMQGNPHLSETESGNLAIINRSGEHLLALINDVLEMSKIEAGRLQLELAPLDLGGLVRDVADMMHLRAEERGLQLRLDQASAFPRYILGDEARLRQVLVNLVSNAVKFTERGGVVIRLGIKEGDRRYLLIEVEDSGPGISAEDQLRIFKPFVQLSEGAEQKGTGLGLTITKQFVELMGGSIGVDSTLGKGSLFRVELPAGLVEPSVTRPEAVGDVAGLAPGQTVRRILIAEDQHENQLLLQRLMTDLGLETRVVENGGQCVKAFEAWHPDLIWMDRRMPVMDGVEATRRIRQLPGGDQVRIVAVTASAFREQRQEMLDAGMNDFVSKPYRFTEIYDCLARQLGLKYLYRADESQPALVTPTAEMVAALPPALSKELRGALERLDSERINELLTQVAAVDADLARALSRRAERFDYEAILRVMGDVGG